MPPCSTRLRTELGDTRGWHENVKEELRIRTERITTLEGALQHARYMVGADAILDAALAQPKGT